MSPSQPLKVAVLSFAHTHAGSYIRNLVNRDDVELLTSDPHGVSGAEGPRGADYAALFGADYVNSYEEAFAWRPDAVVICSENSRHAELIKQAAAAGVDILCEKPLATTIEDAEAAIAATVDAGVKLMTAYPVRYAPAHQELKALISSGALGTIISVLGTNNGVLPKDRAWFTDPQLAGGGALVDHVVHCADLLDDLLGQSARTVYATTNKVLYAEQNPAVETGGLVTITYPTGVVASIDCSWSQARNAPNWGGLTLSVIGTLGSVKIDPFAQHVSGFDATGAAWLPFGSDLDALMIEHFLELVRGAELKPDADSGLRTLAIVKAAQESAASGMAVSV